MMQQLEKLRTGDASDKLSAVSALGECHSYLCLCLRWCAAKVLRMSSISGEPTASTMLLLGAFAN